MGFNRAEQSIENRLIDAVAQLERDMREIKGLQPIGSDILRVISAPATPSPLLAGPFNIAAGSSATINISTFPLNEILTLWNFAHTVYVDAFDEPHQWPSGSSLTSESREIDVTSWLDWADSSDTSNERTYKVRIKNNSPSLAAHDYYVAFKAYFPKGSVA